MVIFITYYHLLVKKHPGHNSMQHHIQTIRNTLAVIRVN